MAIVLTTSSTLVRIVEQAEKLSDTEQQEVLAFINARWYKKQNRLTFVKPEKGVKPLTMAQIDKIKHEVRKLYAGK